MLRGCIVGVDIEYIVGEMFQSERFINLGLTPFQNNISVHIYPFCREEKKRQIAQTKIQTTSGYPEPYRK